jgi:hypothetical protein
MLTNFSVFRIGFNFVKKTFSSGPDKDPISPLTTEQWITEDGDFIVTEDGDNIVWRKE